jgi:glycosyltransferase involved in cell wall biosynthesis
MRISVIIPCYNAEELLGRAIESVWSQTRPVNEVIVVDDCSDDDSRQVASSYRAKLVALPCNRGHAAARNRGLSIAAGDVIAWLDADDFWDPHHIETVVGLLDRHANAAVAFSGVRYVGSRSGVWTNFPCSEQPKRVLRECYQYTLVPAMSAVTRRAAVEAVGGFDESIRTAPDFDLWLRMARKFLFVSSDAITANYRWHVAQISAVPQRQMLSMWQTRAKFIESLWYEDDVNALGELKDIAAELWEARLWTLWYRAEMKELRIHMQRSQLLPRVPAIATRFRFRRMLPATLVSTWHRLSNKWSPIEPSLS